MMNLIFEPLSVPDPKTVIRLSDEIISELSLMVVLGPLAVVNLRAQYSNYIDATDASCDTLAAVRADISPLMSQELARHSLLKGNWSRLLSPMKAWAKGHGTLDPAEEILGESDEAYSTPSVGGCSSGTFLPRNVEAPCRAFTAHQRARAQGASG